MEIQFLPVLVCAVLSMVIGAIWYGPMLFGKAWGRLNGMSAEQWSDPEVKKKLKGEMAFLYTAQFLLTLFQVWVLAHYIEGWSDASGLTNALSIWIAFIIPTLAGAVMWTGGSKKDRWQRFFIQAGYQLILFIAFGLILGVWR